MAPAEMIDGSGDDTRLSVVVHDLDITYRVFGSAHARREDAAEGRSVRGLVERGRQAAGVVEVPAVRGVTFVAHHGESIGVIGRNGSGKSTLLKAVAGLIPPAGGSVYVRGQVALLGVQAVLVQKLSGIDNIILGGQAQGLSKSEIQERIPEIVEFSGLGDKVYRPMNTYSSGEQARLRFAISSAVAPDVLIVDEALATGDADFRQRSAERVQRIREEAGTVFVVSHSNATITKLCTRALWMDAGELIMDGPAADVVAAYDATFARKATPRHAGGSRPSDPDVPGVDRWGGGDRTATALAVTSAAYEAGVPGVVIANERSPLAVLAAMAILAPRGWPLLLVKRGLLDERTLTELHRLSPQQVLVLGDDSLVAHDIESQIVGAFPAISVERCVAAHPAGVVRFLVRAAGLPSGETVLVGSTAQRRRLLGFTLRAARLRAPLIITEQSSLDEDARALLAELCPQRVLLMGGADAVSEDVARELVQLTGTDPEVIELTSPQEALADLVSDDPSEMALVTLSGLGPASLVALSAAAGLDLPLLLVTKDEIPSATAGALRTLAPRKVVVVGGTRTISPTMRTALGQHVHG